MPYAIFGLICVGLLGASLFTTGIIFGMMAMVAGGIAVLAMSLLGMLLYYIYCQQPSVQSHSAVAYTTNNMMNRHQGNNTLMLSAFSTKRNKSDTDLELMSQQTETQV